MNPETNRGLDDERNEVRTADGPEHEAPDNPEWSSTFDEYAGREDSGVPR